MSNAPKFRDAVFRIVDYTEALELLLQLGLLDKIQDPSRLPEGRCAFLAHKNHPTHWILVGKFSGCANPKDNGLIIFGWIKTKWPKTVMREQVDDYSKSIGRITPGNGVVKKNAAKI